MKVTDLYNLPTEAKLTEWLRQFTELDDLLASVPQLFAGLTETLVLGVVEDGAVIVGPVHVGEGAVVRANSILLGPVILGTNVDVNYGAIIRDCTYIGSDSRVDSGSITTQSLVLNRTKIGERVSIRQCIVGVGSSISVGAILGSQIGSGEIDAATFVGDMVAIGAGCRVDAGSTVAARSILKNGTFVSNIDHPNKTF